MMSTIVLRGAAKAAIAVAALVLPLLLYTSHLLLCIWAEGGQPGVSEASG